MDGHGRGQHAGRSVSAADLLSSMVGALAGTAAAKGTSLQAQKNSQQHSMCIRHIAAGLGLLPGAYKPLLAQIR